MNEVIAFQRDLEEFKAMDAEIIGVSNDDLKTLKKFAEREGISFPLVADTEEAIKNIYGDGRITYLIDKNGVIAFIQDGVPENDTFIEQLKLLK